MMAVCCPCDKPEASDRVGAGRRSGEVNHIRIVIEIAGQGVGGLTVNGDEEIAR